MVEKVKNEGIEKNGKNGEITFVKFESINKERACDIARRFPLNETAVTRAEIILTNRCQLKCVYCKQQLEQACYEKNIDHDVLMNTIEQWLKNGCRFLHFTGGECTLNPHLADYVELAAGYGAEVTLSTNAVSDLAIYENLIRKGANCFHISLDTFDPNKFDSQVGVKGSFERVIKVINLITKMRDEEHYNTRLILNVCITPATFDTIVDIVKFMLSLKPNDIKLIPMSQLKSRWGEYEEKYEKEMKSKLLDMIPDTYEYNMLKSRIQYLVKPIFRGYNNKRVVPPCYLSQDERTIDPEGNYYGCYINYREGAEPIGNINEDSYEEQSKKLRQHMLCFTNSEICQKYCSDITVMCNKFIDQKVHENEVFNFLNLGNVNILRSGFGNKAYNIERLYEEGILVPKSLFFNAHYLSSIYENKDSKELKAVQESLNDMTYSVGMKQWILSQDENAEIKLLVSKFMKDNPAENYVVRSSSTAEDSTEKSYAGAFDTILNLKSEKEICEAIKKVYASKYTYLVDNQDEVQMGVILEVQIPSEYSGVAFSKNPITGKDEIVINYSKGLCENVVSGEATSEIILQTKEEISDKYEISKDILEMLKSTLLKIQSMFDAPVDVEWTIYDNKLYVLQAREITTIVHKEKIKGQNIYIDSLDTEKLNKYDLSCVSNSHKKYMSKHYLVRAKAAEANVNFPSVGYLFYNKTSLTQEIFDKLVPDAIVYKVTNDLQIRTLAKEAVVPYLKSLEGEEDNIVRLQQITATNACGNVSVLANGNIYIEYIPGGFGGLNSENMQFSWKVVSPEGKVISEVNHKYFEKWVFNSTYKKFEKEETDAEDYILADNVVSQLIDAAKKLNKIFENPRIEFELEGDKIYLNDITFENNSIDGDLFENKVLSEGSIGGEIRVLDDIDEIRTILKNRSIVAESEFYKAERSDQLKDFLKKINVDLNKKYVFVCRKAHPSLSVLMKYSSGFIFETGGMLSHMAIILRENKIPGMIIENALFKYKDGEIIS